MTPSPELEGMLRSYALGRLAEEPRLALEERLVSEPEVLEALGVVEDELTEEYLERSLLADERRDFEQSFLSSPERQRLLGFFDALKTRASKPPAPMPAPRPLPSRWSLPSRWQPVWALAASLLLALSLSLNLWQGLRLESAPSAAPPPRPESSPALAARAAEPSVRTVAAPLAPTQTTFEPPRTAFDTTQAPRVPTFTLAAGLTRGSGSLARVAVPAGATGIRLRLELPQAEYGQYRATLRDAEGDELWTAAKLRPAQGPGRAVLLMLPAEVLPRGDYQLQLAGVRENGELEPLASYAFRVTGE